MMKEVTVKQRSPRSDLEETWASFLQRRVMRFLLLHDRQLFRSQFRTFYTGSSFADHPLLRFYDQHIKLLALSEELFDDILPRIHLQWSQLTEHTIVQEENPTRGQIDWQRTIEQASNEAPGQLPLRFATRLRQQRSTLPENLLTVAVLLHHRQLVHDMLRTDQQEEILTGQERRLLITIEEQLERELATSRVSLLIEEARKEDLDLLVEQVKIHLPLGSGPYRDLLDWWEQFSALQVGSATAAPRLSLTHGLLPNAQMDRWLYELWIAVEFITLLQEQNALLLDTLNVIMDRLSFTFTWHGRRYRFRYQRQGSAGASSTHHWEHVPAIYSSYVIERDNPLVVEYKGKRSWQEAPVVVDVAYTADTAEAMQRLMGNMTVHDTVTGLLISPYLDDPHSGTQISGEVRYEQQRYSTREQEVRIECYKMTPDIPLGELQERVQAVLQQIVASLPERPQPVCCGVMLDQDSRNASASVVQEFDVLCPKPHVGPGVYDLVSRERHCLKDPRLCHVINQIILPPQVKRVVNLNDLKLQVEQLRRYGVTSLKQAEEEGNDEKAEQFRSLILHHIGQTIELYVRMRGNTVPQEKFLHDGIFKQYWDQHAYCLEADTRHILISGEYVWDEYQDIQLDDWAAPAIQYCRALEREIKRRFFTPVAAEYTYRERDWTLGKIKAMYGEGKPGEKDKNWQAFTNRALGFEIKKDVLIEQFVDPMVMKEQISDLRNDLAHGKKIDRETARKLRDAVLSISGQESLLTWMVRNIGP